MVIVRRIFQSGALLAIAASSCLWSQNYDGVFQNARSLLKDQRYSEAAAEARKAIALDRARWEAYYVAAAAYAGLQRCEAALPYFQSALDHGAPQAIQGAINSAVAQCEQEIKNQAPTPAASVQQAPNVRSAPSPAGLLVPQSLSYPEPAPSRQTLAFPVFHGHRFNYGPGILTLGPTVTFIETMAGPSTADNMTIYSKDQFSVPLNQVVFAGFHTVKGYGWGVIDGKNWEERTGKTVSGDMLVLEVAGKKWEFEAPNEITRAIADALKAIQGR